MTTGNCPRESDTIRAAWGAADGPGPNAELSRHLAECRTCADIAAMAALFREERGATCAKARVPAAGLVWWRAQLRAHQEAARKAAQPIALIHAIALGIALGAVAGVALAAVSGIAPFATRGWNVFLDTLGTRFWAPLLQSAGSAAFPPFAIALVLATSLVLMPIAIYLALGER